MKEELNLIFQCEKCGEKFNSKDSTNIVHKKEFKVDGQSIFLTYYDCPKCFRRHFVQIDDVNSLEELKEAQRAFIKLCILKRKGKKISKKQSDNFKKTREHLGIYRMQLMERFTGKTIVDEDTGLLYVLRFSI